MSATPKSHSKAVVFGLSGTRLSAEERAFFAKADPLGFILFARNIENPEQVRALTSELRACVGRPSAPILIDQEGGRVQRLKPPHWRQAPPARKFGDLWRANPTWGRAAARLNALILALELADVGIDVNCTPVLDIPAPEAHDVIGDRAFALDPVAVAELGREVCEGLLAGGVAPVIKHLPGHGRARADSHLELPRVDAALVELEAVDFAPFRALRLAPWGMTAHIVYSKIDPQAPATLSPTVVREIIRGRIGFEGVLLTDDLSMKALTGSYSERCERALAAGCDVILHCNGDMAEMTEVAAATPALRPDSLARLANACERKEPLT